MIPEPRDMQMRAVFTALEYGKAVIIDRTGGGNTHSIHLLGTMLRGVIVVFHPLLALMGDQILGFFGGM